MSSDLALMLSVGAGVIALIYGGISIKWILAQSAGNERMQRNRRRDPGRRQRLPEPSVHSDWNRRRRADRRAVA